MDLVRLTMSINEMRNVREIKKISERESQFYIVTVKIQKYSEFPNGDDKQVTIPESQWIISILGETYLGTVIIQLQHGKRWNLQCLYNKEKYIILT